MHGSVCLRLCKLNNLTVLVVQIREDTKTGVYVDSLSEEYVSNVGDVSRLLVKVWFPNIFLLPSFPRTRYAIRIGFHCGFVADLDH